MARPEKPLDWDIVDKMLMADCFGTEIAARFNMHPDTFYNKVFAEHNVGFTEYSALKKGQGDALIKECQFSKATEDKDNTMLIYLGKVRLQQREQSEPPRPPATINIHTTGNRPLVQSETDPLPDGLHSEH